MKKIFTIILTAFLAASTYAQVFPNGDFEDWEFNWDYEEDSLIGWKCGYVYNQVPQPLAQSEDAQNGNYSVLVQNPGYSDVENKVYITIPYTSFDEDALIGYYKTELAKDGDDMIVDSALISVVYFKGKKNIKADNVIYFTSDASEWTFFQLKLKKSAEADSIRFSLTSSANDLESKMWVDNISLSDYVDVENANSTTTEFAVYPNPADKFINVVVDNQNAKVEILTTTGQVLKSYTNISHNRTVTINRSEFGAGLYLIRVTGSNGSAVKPVTFK
ncbi:MAG: T9SS type A sorting domain-containing protein [Bacteroidia bacterium]